MKLRPSGLPVGVACCLLTAACGSAGTPDPGQQSSASSRAGASATPDASSTVPSGSGQPDAGTPTGAASPEAVQTLLDDEQLEAFQERFGPGASVAVLASGGEQVDSAGSAKDPLAWSTMKLVQAVRAVQDAGGVADLSRSTSADVRAALTRSDNEASLRLWKALVARQGSTKAAVTAMEAVLRQAGDRRTQVTGPRPDWFARYGETPWTPKAQVVFMDALARGCLLPEKDTRWLLRLMGKVVDEQRWGLLQLDGARAKGGWGPDDDGDYLVRQVGTLRARNGGTYSVAVMVRPDDGTYDSGIAELDRIAAWLDRNIPSAPAAVACAP